MQPSFPGFPAGAASREERKLMLHGVKALLVVFLSLWICGPVEGGAGYTVVVSRATNALSGWQPVVRTLVAKHKAEVLVFDGEVGEALAGLRKQLPRYTCFVAPPKEATGAFVAAVHRLTRKLDEDPYTDTLWGILTGYDANCLLYTSPSPRDS